MQTTRETPSPRLRAASHYSEIGGKRRSFRSEPLRQRPRTDTPFQPSWPCDSGKPTNLPVGPHYSAPDYAKDRVNRPPASLRANHSDSLLKCQRPGDQATAASANRRQRQYQAQRQKPSYGPIGRRCNSPKGIHRQKAGYAQPPRCAPFLPMAYQPTLFSARRAAPAQGALAPPASALLRCSLAAALSPCL